MYDVQRSIAQADGQEVASQRLEEAPEKCLSLVA
jgi:hypothetical protein